MMDEMRFDRLTRSLAVLSARRGIVAGMAGAALGLVTLRFPGDVAAGRTRKKPKDPKLNIFGCVNVGGKCRGRDGLCCSGICDGKKPKRGQKDKSRCVAHNEGACQPGEDVCLGNQVACGNGGVCARTTGNAPFCVKQGAGACTGCSNDLECEVLFGPGSACLICPAECGAAITGCFQPGT